VAAALRRGMLDEGEAGKNGVDGNNIHPAFRISGQHYDRLVVEW
jgi:tRNA 2-thiouridine synthesizing protein D